MECKAKGTQELNLVKNRINRNIVECKAIRIILACFHGPGINRNIVECKETCDDGIENRYRGINRNIVECKAGKERKNTCYSVVLIETLWNVKSCDRRAQSVRTLRINRNIVECKA